MYPAVMKAVDSFFSIFFLFTPPSFFLLYLFLLLLLCVVLVPPPNAWSLLLSFTRSIDCVGLFFLGCLSPLPFFIPFLFFCFLSSLFLISLCSPFQIPRNIRTHVHPPCAEASCCTACTGSPNRWYATLYQSVQVRSPSLSTANRFLFFSSLTRRDRNTHIHLYFCVCACAQIRIHACISLYMCSISNCTVQKLQKISIYYSEFDLFFSLSNMDVFTHTH